jgi:hypothetical protein
VIALSLKWLEVRRHERSDMRPQAEGGSSAGILEKAMLYDELVRGQK